MAAKGKGALRLSAPFHLPYLTDLADLAFA
jgi:hypothetical protein